ncbi:MULTISPECIES: hypothetical protein [unclassified Sphingomonas]|uniref:head-tail connector protein n=1 Tax=unclassified Sphingomonas TaxID=196159 RepID=UPI00226A2017|nr:MULTISPECIES: hypothetical protein [unclassified Sphingomonas]
MTQSAIPPAVVARAAAAAGAYLRLQGGDEDALLTTLAASALALAEAFLGSPCVIRASEDLLSAGSGWQRLAQAPVVAIDGITGLPADGAPFVLPVQDYGYDIAGDGTGWVRVLAPGAAGRVAVAYRAGLAADWDALPAPIAQGVAMLAAHLFERRDGDGAPPAAIAALWRPYRRMHLGGQRAA